MSHDELDRRSVLLAGLAAGSTLAPAAWAAAPPSRAQPAPRALPTDPREHTAAMVRLFGDTNGGHVVWKTRGTIYAVQPGGITPLYRMLGSEQSWWKRTGEYSWMRYPSTCSFFVDLKTGEWLEDFVNPLNGVTVKLPASFIRHKEGEFYTPNGHWFGSMKQAFPEHYADHPLQLDWDLTGDLVRVQSSSKFPPILPQPSLENVTLFSPAHELLDPKVSRASAHTGGWNIFAWHPYLKMGDAPGHIIWHFDAVKVASIDELGQKFLARARAFTPQFERSPETDEGPSFFEKILAARKAAGKA